MTEYSSHAFQAQSHNCRTVTCVFTRYHSDALGSTRGITNTSQTATDSQLFDAWGMVVSRTGSTPTPFGFAGTSQYQTDTDSGLQLLGHRYYDPSTGRLITQDPARDGENWYQYCRNNPLGGVDPNGLQSKRAWANVLKAKWKSLLPGLLAYQGCWSTIEYMEYPFPPHDKGNIGVGAGGGAITVVAGTGLVESGIALTADVIIPEVITAGVVTPEITIVASGGALLGGSIIVTGGLVAIAIGSAGIIYGGGRYFGWW